MLTYSNFSTFQYGGRRNLGFLKIVILTVDRLYGANVRHHTKFCQIGLMIADISQCNFYQKDGRPPSWIFKIHFSTVGTYFLHRHICCRQKVEYRPVLIHFDYRSACQALNCTIKRTSRDIFVLPFVYSMQRAVNAGVNWRCKLYPRDN